MSKYDLNYNVEEEKSPLIEGENLIWSGKPKKSAFIVNKILVMAPFALVWLGIDSAIITAFFSTGAVNDVLFFIIPFFAIHLFPVWVWLGNILTANKKWKNTKYYITDKRIIIQNGFIASNYQTVYYKDIKNVNLHVGIIDKLLGVGDIYFDLGSRRASDETLNMVTGFLDIVEYNELYQKVQKVVLDIQTDIQYPNALRPETNPGYNTTYKPEK